MEFRNLAVRVLIDGLVKLITDEKLWDTARELVEALWDADLTGEEKAARVKAKLRAIGGITSKSLLNILNELAYLYVKALKGQL